MLHLNLFMLALSLAHLLSIVAAPLNRDQFSLNQASSEECAANLRLLSADLDSAAQTMTRVQLRFDRPAVTRVMEDLGGAAKQLDTLQRAVRFGARTDPAVMGDLVALATNARAALDEVYGVPDVTTARAVTSAVWTVQDALSMAQAVQYTC